MSSAPSTSHAEEPAAQPVVDMPYAVLAALLFNLNACTEAREWADEHRASFQQLWLDCARGDWLLWLLENARVELRLRVLAGCACARLVLEHVSKEGRHLAAAALEAAEAWCIGEAAPDAVRQAVEELYEASAAWSLKERYAALAIVWARRMADPSRDCRAWMPAVAAVDVAGWGRNGAAFAMLAECAEAVRKAVPWHVVAAALQQRGEEVRHE